MSKRKRVKLQFPNMYSLWKFAQEITSKSIEIITPAKTLICDCSEDELSDAISDFGAKIIEVNLIEA